VTNPLTTIAEFYRALDAFLVARKPDDIRRTLDAFHAAQIRVANLVVENTGNYFLVHSAFTKADARLTRAMDEAGLS
jgi:hypothetical protein